MTIKGGVVMRSKTGNIRRATQDLDMDFIRYSLADDSIELFVKKLDCLEGISIRRTGNIETLKQQDYQSIACPLLQRGQSLCSLLRSRTSPAPTSTTAMPISFRGVRRSRRKTTPKKQLTTGISSSQSFTTQTAWVFRLR